MRRNYAICGVGVTVEAPSPLDDVERLLVGHFDAARTSRDDPGITIRFDGRPVPFEERGDEVFRSEVLRVFLSGKSYFVWCGQSVLEVEPARNRATGFLDDDFRHMPPSHQRVFLFLPLLALLARHGLYGIHASGLVDGGVGYLVAGDSKHGKTTLGLALLKEGWGYLSDDTVLLRAAGRGVEALPFRLGFACDAETAARYPELRAPVDPGKEGKILLDVAHAYAERRVERCAPGIVMFSEIGAEARSELLGLDPTCAFARLVRHSPFTLQTAAEVQRHAEVLGALVSQAACYRLRLGQDVYREPAAVSRLLREVRSSSDGQDCH